MNKIFTEIKEEKPIDAAKRFLSGEYDCGDFIKKKLKKNDYDFLAAFAHAMISPNSDYTLVANGEKSFNMFMQIMDTCAIKEEDKEKLVYGIYNASEKSPLKLWTKSADEYLARKLQANPSYAYTLLKTDTTGLAYPLVFIFGKNKGDEIILKALLTFRVANRGKARRLIFGSPVAISLIPAYEEMNTRERGEFVRLMILDKVNHESVEFIKNVYYNEPSKRIVHTIRDEVIYPYAKTIPLQEYEEDEKSLYSPFVMGRRYKIRIKNYKVKKAVSQNTEVNNAIKAKATKVKKELKACKQYLYENMVSRNRWAAEMFMERLNNDKLFYYLCDKLYFALYNGNIFEDIVIISDGKIITADGKNVNIENKQILVAHPMLFTGRYAYLKLSNNVDQPFEQIDRPVYEPSDTDIAFNTVSRFSGSVITVAQLKKRMRGTGFHLKRDANGEFSYATMLWQGVYCVVKFSEFDYNDPDSFVRVMEIRFYDFKDVAKKLENGSWESARVMPISTINPALFSEFMLIFMGIFSA